MRFNVARGELLESLSIVGKGLSSRSTLPILSGLLLSAKEDTITIQSTDLEVSIKSSLKASVEEEGQVVLPGKLLSDIVRSLPEAAVTIEVKKDSASVECGTTSFTLHTLPAGDFPKFPEVSVNQKIELPLGVLSGMTRQVLKAVSRDETRPILTGVLLVVSGTTIRMVATDSYRLSVREVDVENPIGEDIEVVLPGKSLDEAVKMASLEETLTLGVAENQVVFSFKNTVFVTRRIEGNFPNYRQLIPKETETSFTVSRNEFIDAVKRVSLMAQQSTPLRVKVAAEDQTVSLSATTQDVGMATEDLMANTQGTDMEIAFNHTFLTEGLLSAPEGEIIMKIVSPLKPGVIEIAGDEGFLYLLMPVRLG
jgi:DNA polymerase-3 subunit beta